MLFKIVVLRFAKSDIQLSVNWYEKIEEGLGRKLKHQIVRAIDSIADPVRGYGSVYMGLSRIFVDNFPYCIYFKLDTQKQQIVVYALLHERQNRDNILTQRIKP